MKNLSISQQIPNRVPTAVRTGENYEIQLFKSSRGAIVNTVFCTQNPDTLNLAVKCNKAQAEDLLEFIHTLVSTSTACTLGQLFKALKLKGEPNKAIIVKLSPVKSAVLSLSQVVSSINKGSATHGFKAIQQAHTIQVSTSFQPRFCNITIDGTISFNSQRIDGADIIRLGKLLNEVYLK